MTFVYSTYEAKKKFGQIIRQVRSGQPVVITYRGERVAEIRPLVESKENGLQERLKRLEGEGALERQSKPTGPLTPLARRRGALNRFLESRK
jgi:prevent-host-death family protein